MITCTRRADVVAAPWGDGALLLDLEDRRLHELNGPAAAVWNALQLGEADAVPDLLAERYAVPADQLRPDITRVLRDFDAEGLLGPAGCTSTPPGSVPPPVRPTGRCLGRFGAGMWRFSVWCTDDAVAREVGRVLGPLRVRDQTESGADGRIEIVHENPADLVVSIRCDGQPVISGAPPGTGLDVLVGAINARAVSGSPGCVAFHAGAVGLPWGAVILPGVSNSGKSTLVAGLVDAGAVYLSDEVALVDPGPGTIVPYPKSISLDPGSFPLLPHLRPDVGPRFAGHRERKWHVEPRGPRGDDQVWPVRAVVAPTHDAGATTRLEPVGRRQAVELLLANSFHFAPAGEAGFVALVRLAREVPVHRLTVGALREATRVVAALR